MMKFFRWTDWYSAVLLAALLLMVLPGRASALPEGDEREIDRVIAVVNNEVITRRELDQRTELVANRLKQSQSPVPPTDLLQRQVLDQMILERIQLQKAKEDNITVDDSAVQRMLEQLAQMNAMSLSDYRARLETQGVPWSVFVRDARHELLISKLRQKEVDSKVTVSNSEVANYLASQSSVNAGAQNGLHKIKQIHVRHILLRVSQGVSEAKVRQQLLDIKREIEQGGDFTAFARGYSQDGSAAQGGELGWVSPGETVPDFERAMNALHDGQVSGPVRTEYGYHLIQVLGRRDIDVPIAQQQQAARQIIGQRKAEQAYDDWLGQLRDSAYIQYKFDSAS